MAPTGGGELGGPYDMTLPVTPPPAPTPRSRRTTALIAAATVAAVAAGVAGGVLALRDDGGQGRAGTEAPSTFTTSGTPTDDLGGGMDGGTGLTETPDPTATWSTATPSPTDIPAGFALQEDTAGSTVAVPEGWDREEKKNGVFYSSPDGRGLLQIYTVTEGDLTPYEALGETSRTLGRTNDNYKQLSLQDVPQDSGGSAAELVYSYDRPDGSRRQVIDRAFEATNGRQYAVLVAGPEGDWPRQREILEVALEHFVP
jgi:hypothetical protein